ncbi:hypothetical protein [Prochlorococcus sp. MIT 1300]|uniref:hypothetical protein n=1 Tax=Prochlorococcus sp. MIT 1300 TaxID=3096218 RepID=UPI002A748935|nr:hypothetical protein [Prochlorococcus sp. MIT 1300]
MHGNKYRSKEVLEEEVKQIQREIDYAKNNLILSLKVLLKAYITEPRGLFGEIQRKSSFITARESAKWHARDIYSLSKAQQEVLKELDRLNGSHWKKRLKRIISSISLIVLFVLSFIFTLGGIALIINFILFLLLFTLAYSLVRNIFWGTKR